MNQNVKKFCRQVCIYVGSIVVCNFSAAQCYPMIPVYFTTMYLFEYGRSMLLGAFYIELLVFLPLTGAVKYGMVLIGTVVGVWVAENIFRKCDLTAAAAIAGIITAVIGEAGQSIMIIRKEEYILPMLEGIFVFAGIMGLGRLIAIWYEENEPLACEEREDNIRQRKLYEYATSFQKLSRIFMSMEHGNMEFSRDNMEQLQQEVTGRVCMNCDQCTICWQQKECGQMEYLFASLLQSIRRYGGSDISLKKQLRQQCTHSEEIIDTMVQVFDRARLNMAWYNRLSENRAAIAQQLDAMAYIMEDCMCHDRDIGEEHRGMLARLTSAMKQNCIRAQNIKLYEKYGGVWFLELRARTINNNFFSIKEMAGIISKVLRRPMLPHPDMKTLLGGEKQTIIFQEMPLFHQIYGMAREIKSGMSVSGDNFSVLELERGEVIMSLSDGMGSGMRACKESEMVVELMERFLEAGFSKETALRMMNSTMVLQGNNDQFSTVDITSIDLYSGQAVLYKIGAAATFVRMNGIYRAIMSRQLPTGVSCQLELEPERLELTDGDMIIMITDGVLEQLQSEQPEEELLDILVEIDTDNPSQFSRRVIEEVTQKNPEPVRDDMLVLCLGIWKNKRGQ